MNAETRIASAVLPERMRRLPKDKRGYPVPYMVLRDVDGTPHFAVNDEWRRLRCLSHQRCSICGMLLLRGRWFVGGPLSAFHPHGSYFDPPLHKECAEYALQVCPYLAAPSYAGSVGARTIDPAKLPATGIFEDRTMMPGRPELFVAVHARKTIVIGPLGQYVKPARPYISVAYWRRGRRLSVEDAAPLLADIPDIDVDAALTEGP